MFSSLATPMHEPNPSHPLLKRQDIEYAIRACRQQLEVIQGRLGTPAERPGDIDQASDLVHKINNLTAALSEAW